MVKGYTSVTTSASLCLCPWLDSEEAIPQKKKLGSKHLLDSCVVMGMQPSIFPFPNLDSPLQNASNPGHPVACPGYHPSHPLSALRSHRLNTHPTAREWEERSFSI